MQLPYANLQMKHQNPGAEMPLILPVHVICNTSDDEIYGNIKANSEAVHDWLDVSEAHDGVAILCGSGPSIRDSIKEIRMRQAYGGKVFAMNGCAKFLSENGIMPDYQVIIDARSETANLVGPAERHMFASQVHPDCFAKAPSATLWHLQVENIDAYLPDHEDSFCMIGGAASVGNTATCLAYAMGYRDLQIFGYDSSFKDGTNHAFSQPMNDGEPCAVVHFNGKEYVCSLTMKLQAEKFMVTSRHLADLGCKLTVHGHGLLPDMFNTPVENMTEQAKYERMWSISAYRNVSPGEDSVDTFLSVCKPDGLVIDFGCGTGRAGVKIAESGCNVILLDFTENSRDNAAKNLPFWQHDLTKPVPHQCKFGYCTDVMEHIPPEDVEVVIKNIMASAHTTFFQISTVPDVLGALINQHLHLTVQPHQWWKEKLASLGYQVSYESESPEASIFVVKR